MFFDILVGALRDREIHRDIYRERQTHTHRCFMVQYDWKVWDGSQYRL